MSYDAFEYNLNGIFTNEELNDLIDSWEYFYYRLKRKHDQNSKPFTIKDLEKILKNPEKYNKPEHNLIYICVYLLKFESGDKIDKLISDYLLSPFFPPSRNLFNRIRADYLNKIITIMKKYNNHTEIELFKINKLERLLLEKNI